VSLRAIVALAGLVAIAGPGCSALSSRDPGAALCAITDGVDPCPPPLHCVDERCMAPGCAGEPSDEICDNLDNDCDGTVDDDAFCADGRCVAGECRTDCAPDEVLCDHLDDDCNGHVDEGLARDEDNDTYSSCPQDGTATDCNDRNENIHPRAAEICNGVDDDCDPVTIESVTNDCGAGLTCAVPPGETIPRCVDPRDCTQFACMTGEICNAMHACCTTGEPGCGTTTDCTTMGCAAGSRCLPDATGGTFSCVEFGRVGDACMRSADCRSGRCYRRSALALDHPDEGICGTACCSDADCAATDACWSPGTGARSCVPRAQLPAAVPPACSTEGDCASDTCAARTFDTPEMAGSGTGWTCGPASMRTCSSGACPSGACTASDCVTPCGRSAGDCRFDFTVQEACVYYAVGDRVITGCGTPSGYGQHGDSCGGPLDFVGCLDGLCFSGHCVALCCHDADCPSGTVCTPYDNSGWEMRCLPAVAGPAA
jgi:hypothetical protein